MANTFTAPFVQKYKTKTAIVTLAVPSLNPTTGSGAMLVATAGTNGAVVTRLTAIPRETVTAQCLVLFLVKAATPTVLDLIDSELMPAATVGTTSAVPETVFSNISDVTPVRLEAGDMLYVASRVAVSGGIVFNAQWGDL